MHVMQPARVLYQRVVADLTPMVKSMAILPALLSVAVSGTAAAVELMHMASPAAPSSLAPRLVSGPGEPAILTWLEREGTTTRFRFARFNGTQFGDPVTISAGERYFTNWADRPGMYILGDGTWIAHWLQRSGESPYAYDIMTVLSGDRGETWSSPVTPHRDGTQSEHGFLSYFPATAGASSSPAAGMVWLDGRATVGDEAGHVAGGHGSGHGAMTLRTATVLPDGSIEAPAMLDERVCDCCGTAAGMTSDGVVIAYRDRTEEEIRDIKVLGHRDGAWTEPVSVFDDRWHITGCPVNGPALLARDRSVVVAWFTMDEDTPLLRVARSRDSGRSFEPPVEFDRGTALGRVALTWTEQGFVLIWLAETTGGAVLRLAHFTDSISHPPSRDVLPLEDGRVSGFPELLTLPDGELLLTWTGRDATSGSSRVQVGRIRLQDTPQPASAGY